MSWQRCLIETIEYKIGIKTMWPYDRPDAEEACGRNENDERERRRRVTKTERREYCWTPQVQVCKCHTKVSWRHPSITINRRDTTNERTNSFDTLLPAKNEAGAGKKGDEQRRQGTIVVSSCDIVLFYIIAVSKSTGEDRAAKLGSPRKKCTL